MCCIVYMPFFYFFYTQYGNIDTLFHHPYKLTRCHFTNSALYNTYTVIPLYDTVTLITFRRDTVQKDICLLSRHYVTHRHVYDTNPCTAPASSSQAEWNQNNHFRTAIIQSCKQPNRPHLTQSDVRNLYNMYIFSFAHCTVTSTMAFSDRNTCQISSSCYQMLRTFHPQKM